MRRAPASRTWLSASLPSSCSPKLLAGKLRTSAPEHAVPSTLLTDPSCRGQRAAFGNVHDQQHLAAIGGEAAASRPSMRLTGISRGCCSRALLRGSRIGPYKVRGRRFCPIVIAVLSPPVFRRRARSSRGRNFHEAALATACSDTARRSVTSSVGIMVCTRISSHISRFRPQESSAQHSRGVGRAARAAGHLPRQIQSILRDRSASGHRQPGVAAGLIRRNGSRFMSTFRARPMKVNNRGRIRRPREAIFAPST